MNYESFVSFRCPHCDKMTDVFIEIESHSDYYPDKNCEHCGKEIEDSTLDNKILDEVNDYFVGMADWYKE